MPKIIMKTTTSGSLDGIHITDYIAGREYDIDSKLSSSFISMGVAAHVRTRKKVDPIIEQTVESLLESKSILSSPENKMIKVPPDKKEKDKKEENSKEKTTRVYQLADELNISSKEILKIARKLGIFVRVSASGLSKEEEERIKSELKLR